MQTVRSNKTETVSVTNCPLCGAPHQFVLQAVIDQFIGVAHMFTERTEVRTCAVTCPNEGLPLMVVVPVLLTSDETLVSIK